MTTRERAEACDSLRFYQCQECPAAEFKRLRHDIPEALNAAERIARTKGDGALLSQVYRARAALLVEGVPRMRASAKRERAEAAGKVDRTYQAWTLHWRLRQYGHAHRHADKLHDLATAVDALLRIEEQAPKKRRAKR